VKKINPCLVFLFIIIFLAVVSIDNFAVGAPSNSISTSGKAIHLKYWQIAKDSQPKSNLLMPPDSLWHSFDPSSDNNNNYVEGNWLLKTNILINDSVSSKVILGLFPIYYVTAYDIYWDAQKISHNGIIGINNTDEKAGLLNFNLPLSPNQVTKGNHLLILRLSNHRNISSYKWYYGDFVVGPYDTVLKKIFKSIYQAFFISGILLIPFLFNLFLYVARKRKTEHLLFSLICFIVILDAVTSLVPVLFDAPTTFAHLELYAYQIITILFTVLFPAFFIYSFAFSKKFIGLIIVVNLTIYLFFTNLANVFNIMSVTVLIISSIITIWALFKRREESLIIILGIIVAWAAYFLNFAFAGLAATMVICTTFSIARQFARSEKAERDAQLRSAHLENELLKKNINPHFILNTLTSVIVWLRKDPASAIKLIEALAEEFRMISQISPLKQIPVKQEIDLCNAHLKIMSYRKGADYKLETVDILEEENVPPMIFHTLIENGLTHGYENKMQGTFTLQRRINSHSLQYVLSNDGDYISDEQKKSSGFGLKYIKSRLEESYPDRWNFISHRLAQGWETIIEIKD
jgi:sensor histidine kinase YesM